MAATDELLCQAIGRHKSEKTLLPHKGAVKVSVNICLLEMDIKHNFMK